jgi:nucleotide-binding universal stress UspA family protein
MSREISQSTLMVNLGCNEHDNDLLAVTGDLAQQMNAAVMGVAAYELVTNAAIAVTGMSGLSSPQELLDNEVQQAESRIAQAKAHFFDVLKGKAGPLLWRSSITNASATAWLVRNARAADFIITHPFADGSYASTFRRVNPGDLIMTLGRPELLLPCGLKKLKLRTILVAWRDTRESRLAVAAALPLLALADRVIVAEVVQPDMGAAAQIDVDDVCSWLLRHSVKAESHIEITNSSEAQEICTLIGSTGCDLLVAGAYGHSRMREWTFGGVTLDLLLRPRCATLIAH